MNFLHVLVWFLVVVFLIFVGFIINCLYKNKDTTSIWSCFSTKKTEADSNTASGSNQMFCEFEGESTFNKMIFKRDGTPVTEQPDKMTCDECSNYIYKGSPGGCYDLGYDKELQAEGAVIGVCTAAFTKKSCPF